MADVARFIVHMWAAISTVWWVSSGHTHIHTTQNFGSGCYKLSFLTFEINVSAEAQIGYVHNVLITS